jgi:hypothetical protein
MLPVLTTLLVQDADRRSLGRITPTRHLPGAARADSWSICRWSDRAAFELAVDLLGQRPVLCSRADSGLATDAVSTSSGHIRLRAHGRARGA